jgi:PrtD family type I secretion system ABC transporter
MSGPAKPVDELVQRCRGPLLAAAGFSLANNLLMLTIPLYMMQVFDRVLLGRSADTLLFLTVLGLGALGLFGLFEAVRARVLARIGSWFEEVLGLEAFVRAMEPRNGRPASGMEALRDVAQLRNFLSGQGVFALFDAPWVPVYVGVLFLLHAYIGYLAVAGAVLLLALTLVSELTTRPALHRANGLGRQSQRQAEATARNAEVVDAMGMLPAVLRLWHTQANAVRELQQQANDRAGLIHAATRFARLALQLLTLGVGAYLVLGLEMTAGMMIAGSIILSRALAPIEHAIGTWRQLVAAREAYNRLNSYLAAPRLRESGIPLPRPEGRLTIESLVLVFPGAKAPTLRGINLTLEPGESLAIVGPSASGKTTLTRSIVGTLRPTNGSVRLDGADVFTWPREDFGQYVGYLPQDVELFDGTVRDNIARLADAPSEAVVAAAQLAGCHEMILRLPNGYDTVIGEQGTYLSAGQQQRVALARALFGEPRLVVLDEPNANLDTDGEQALVRALATLRADGATVVMVSHKPSLIQGMDRMAVMRNGVLEQAGPLHEIIPRLLPDKSKRTAAQTAEEPRVVTNAKPAAKPPVRRGTTPSLAYARPSSKANA